MKENRFDGTEKTADEMINAITSNRNINSQAVMYTIIYNAGARIAECFLRAVNDVGLYDERMSFFHIACGSSYVNTMEAVFFLQSMIREGKISQDNVIQLTNQAQFDYFVKCSGISKYLEGRQDQH
jgi:hypothetical protein